MFPSLSMSTSCAAGVDYDLTASRQLATYEANGYGNLPVCIAKTHLSLSSDASLKEKIETIATKVYGAEGVDYDLAASRQLATYEANGYGDLPVCIAKTHLSLSSDASLKGAPTGWRLPVREVRASVGAGFIYPICGDMRTMPGLGATPAAHLVDIDRDGNIINLS